ncbi:MAG: MFS transporter [Thermoproteota archaeon]|jgi:putative MFS transporter
MRIEEILDVEKITPSQRNVLWIARFSWAFVAMEIIIISFTLSLFAKIFNLREFEIGLLASASLIGNIIGAIISGRFSDKIGRRPLFQITLLWYSIFTALTALSNNFYELFILRVLAGIGLGGMLVIDPALLSEFLPPKKRGKLMVSLDLFWPIGSFIALLLSYVFLEILNGNWRGLFLAAAFPAFIVALFRLLVPESPFFLAKTGKIEEAASVLFKLTGKNVNSESITFAIEEKGSYSELFTLYKKRVVAMLAAWTSLNYTYYGLFLWLPTVLNILALYGNNIWFFLALAFLFQLPGYLSAMFLVEIWGRKRTLTVYLLLSGITGITMGLFTNDVLLFTLSMLLVSFFNLGAWGSVYPFTSELYPTKLRGKSFGLAEGIGKVIAVIAPLIFGALYQITGTVNVPLIVTMTVAIIGAIIVLIFAPETKKLIFD